MVMEDAGTSMNVSSSEDIHWRFSQVKGIIETDEQPTDGKEELIVVFL